MDDKTRNAALEKADAMASHIAYPAEMLNNDKLTKFYDGVTVFNRSNCHTQASHPVVSISIHSAVNLNKVLEKAPDTMSYLIE